MKSFKNLVTIFSSVFITLFALFIVLLFIVWHFVLDLPDHEQLINYEPPMVTRVYASNGRLISEYAAEQRSFVPLESVPQIVIDSFLAAEDKNFYKHIGIDFTSIIRAIKRNLNNLSGRPEGASTITQQVAKNFFLSRELSYKRKFKEVLLANKDCRSAILEVSSEGLARINFKIDDYDSTYYIVATQGVD